MPCCSLRPTSLEHTLLPTRAACARRGGPLNNAISRDPQHRPEAYSPKCVEKLFDNSEMAPIWTPASAHNGPRSTISLTRIPLTRTCRSLLAIYQTVSEGLFCE